MAALKKAANSSALDHYTLQEVDLTVYLFPMISKQYKQATASDMPITKTIKEYFSGRFNKKCSCLIRHDFLKDN